MTVWTDMAADVQRIAETVGPGVVRIGRDLRGSGLVIGDGLIVTNAHNLRAGRTTVTLDGGRRELGTVLGVDIDRDLAVVGVSTGDVAPVAWRTSLPSLGEPVFALTRTGDAGPRVTFGIVSAVDRTFPGPRGRRITGSLEHTAPLPRGASGSPIVDAAGSLAGLNTHRLRGGFYLAQPADDALRERLELLGRGESRRPRRLGVMLAPADVARRMRRSVGLPERDGLLVRGVVPDGPAARAGLREGDLIVSAAGADIVDVEDLHGALDRLEAGQRLLLTIVRGSEEHDVAVGFETVEEGEV